MPWVRTASVPIGQVWLRFKGRERNGKPAQMYQIRDMEEKDRKRCLDLMQEHFLKDEPLCNVLKVNTDPVSIATIRCNWERYVSQHVSQACYVEDDGEPGQLVAFNILIVKTRGDEEEETRQEGEPWKRLLKILVMTEELVNVFDHYGVDVYLGDSGLVVHPEHRGQNIGGRLLEAREHLCKALGIEVTATVFTAKASQRLGEKCGHSVLGTLPYSQFLTSAEISGCDTTYSELRGKHFDFIEGTEQIIK